MLMFFFIKLKLWGQFLDSHIVQENYLKIKLMRIQLLPPIASYWLNLNKKNSRTKQEWVSAHITNCNQCPEEEDWKWWMLSYLLNFKKNITLLHDNLFGKPHLKKANQSNTQQKSYMTFVSKYIKRKKATVGRGVQKKFTQLNISCKKEYLHP